MFVETNWLWCKFRVVNTSYRGWFLVYLLSRGFTVSMLSRGFTVFVIMGFHCISHQVVCLLFDRDEEVFGHREAEYGTQGRTER